MKYYYCNVCGNLIEKVECGSSTPVCCGKPMEVLRYASTDGSIEAHVPACHISHIKVGDHNLKVVQVKIGDMPHPATDMHHINWIELETSCGVHRVHFDPATTPKVTFYLPEGEQILNVYSYCNIHGLWKKEVEGNENA